jgi:hypothetical protein
MKSIKTEEKKLREGFKFELKACRSPKLTLELANLQSSLQSMQISKAQRRALQQKPHQSQTESFITA